MDNIINMDEGTLAVQVQYAPHVGMSAVTQLAQVVSPLESSQNNNNTTASSSASMNQRKLNSQIMAQERHLSSELHSALLPTICLEDFPKCTISIQATILQDDGSILTACITAGTLALVDAHVPLVDLVTSCTVAVMVGTSTTTTSTYLCDPTQAELLQASAVICLAMTPNQKEVTLWSQSGRLSASMSNEAIGLCRDGCRTMHKFLREVWITKAEEQSEQQQQ
jgi:ribonuclease PH